MKKILLVLTVFTLYGQIIFGQSQPANQGTNMTFLGLKAYGLVMRFDASADAEKYLVLRSTENITAVPVDGDDYVVGEHLGNAKVFFNGEKKGIYQFRESLANTTYHFAVFAYNEPSSGTSPDYKTDNPLKGSQATLGKTFDGYYDNYRIDTEDAIDDLSSLLKSHTDLGYGDYDENVIVNVLQKDTAVIESGDLVSRKYVVCEYSNAIDVFEESNGYYDFSIFNREHVTARAWMPSSPGSNDDQDETSDYYNLFLVKGDVNQNLRSNYVFDEVVTVSATDNDSKRGDNVDGLVSFEPKESIKGDVARTLFYQIVTYDGVGGSWAFNNLSTYGDDQDVALLVQWHAQDPVDDFEIARNEYINDVQGNRNPFVDNPDWVSCIDFKTLTLNGTCPLDTATVIPIDPSLAITDLNDNNNLVVYPNPTKSNGFVKLVNNENILSLSLMNLNGEKMPLDYDLNNNISTYVVGNLSSGIYFMKVKTNERVYIKKIQILRN